MDEKEIRTHKLSLNTNAVGGSLVAFTRLRKQDDPRCLGCDRPTGTFIIQTRQTVETEATTGSGQWKRAGNDFLEFMMGSRDLWEAVKRSVGRVVAAKEG